MEFDKKRIEELKSYSILDTLPDDDYDNLTMIASEICNTPISLISLLDTNRQWFKSHHGLKVSETPIEYSFCAHAVKTPDSLYVINDARENDKFADNPLVRDDPYIVFYAGVPLISRNGIPLGTLCVIDHKPRDLSESKKQALEALANQVINLLELRKTKLLLETKNHKLEEKYKSLEKFSEIAAHDLKSPLSSISSLQEILQNEIGDKLSPESKEIPGMIRTSIYRLRNLIDGLLSNARVDKITGLKKEKFFLKEIEEEISQLYPRKEEIIFAFNWKTDQVELNKVALMQIFNNLVSNALKYNDKVLPEIEVGGRERDGYYEFYVSDNGPGINEEKQKLIFEKFYVLQNVDRFGNYGSGLGLDTVKSILDDIGGSIELDSEIGEGTIFTFYLPT